jgi:hypothetical protein
MDSSLRGVFAGWRDLTQAIMEEALDDWFVKQRLPGLAQQRAA